MLLDEFFPDTGSAKSDEMKDKNDNDSSENMKYKYADSDEELNKDNSDADDSLRGFKNSYDGSENSTDRNMGKTVLPQELEELVKEALAELKPVG